MVNTTFLAHIAVAALLGGAIGLERGYRAKEAGFRTHFLVALGAALFMILSAHGFDGALVTENHRLDVSRIAAQVVSGIGFIGAGTIIFQRQTVHGLTTAAGLWVTAAIGMAAGAGMYLLATFTALLVLIGLEAFNKLLPHILHRNVELTITAYDRRMLLTALERLKENGVEIVTYVFHDSEQTDKQDGHSRQHSLKVELNTIRSKRSEDILRLLLQVEGISIASE